VPLPARDVASRFSYLQSFAAVLYLERKVGKDRLLALVRARRYWVQTLRQVTALGLGQVPPAQSASEPQ
jgi:hypothetical protein